jgi:hypothetical protein
VGDGSLALAKIGFFATENASHLRWLRRDDFGFARNLAVLFLPDDFALCSLFSYPNHASEDVDSFEGCLCHRSVLGRLFAPPR